MANPITTSFYVSNGFVGARFLLNDLGDRLRHAVEASSDAELAGLISAIHERTSTAAELLKDPRGALELIRIDQQP